MKTKRKVIDVLGNDLSSRYTSNECMLFIAVYSVPREARIRIGELDISRNNIFQKIHLQVGQFSDD